MIGPERDSAPERAHPSVTRSVIVVVILRDSANAVRGKSAIANAIPRMRWWAPHSLGRVRPFQRSILGRRIGGYMPRELSSESRSTSPWSNRRTSLFQPLIYQVAMAAQSQGHRPPIRGSSQKRNVSCFSAT